MLQCSVVVGCVHTVLPWLQVRYWVFSLFPGDMCCTSVQRQQWVTIFTCAVWHLSSSVMKKPSCPTLPRSSQVFHIKYWVHVYSFVVHILLLLIFRPFYTWTTRAFVGVSLMYEYIVSNRSNISQNISCAKNNEANEIWGGVASACTTLPRIVLF